MPDQPYILNPENLEEAVRQMQNLLDDLYHDRLAGAQVGDVFSIDNQSDELTLTLADNSGLQKVGSSLAVLPSPTGPIIETSTGLDVSLASTTKKGACPILPNDAGKVLSGKGTWVNLGGAGTYVVGPGGCTSSDIAEFDGATGYLIKDGGLSHANVASAVSLKHAQQHAITSAADHTSAATSGKMLKADANGLPVNATNTDTEVTNAVLQSRHTYLYFLAGF